jgi:hypothetical protein
MYLKHKCNLHNAGKGPKTQHKKSQNKVEKTGFCDLWDFESAA